MSSPLAFGSIPMRLFDPRRGDPPFVVAAIPTTGLQEPQRSNYYTITAVESGRGKFHIDLCEYEFHGPALLFANPYQTVFLETQAPLIGASLQFHANFFCIETYHEEVGCNGILFNDIYGAPTVQLDEGKAAEVKSLIDQMKSEFQNAHLAQSEILLSYLKVLLIKATRYKLEQQPRSLSGSTSTNRPPPIIARLFTLIEEHYKTLHSPSDYAKMLHMTPKALGKLAKAHLGKTLTILIRERILKHAKWHLLHSEKTVKEVAAEIGFADELYFSRTFKQATGFPPSDFRKFETAIRSGGNLSM